MLDARLASGPLPLPPALADELRRAWGAPPRAYHDLRHLDEVLGHFEEVAAGPGWSRPREIWLALLFHDAVYVAGREDNEKQSANLARILLKKRLPDEPLDLAQIERLILLTGWHGKLEPEGLTLDEALFLDCDMAILGAAPERFAEYDAAIAREYAAVPRARYEAGRRRFLAGLLASPRIFLSPFFSERLEAQARENLRTALAALPGFRG